MVWKWWLILLEINHWLNDRREEMEDDNYHYDVPSNCLRAAGIPRQHFKQTVRYLSLDLWVSIYIYI